MIVNLPVTEEEARRLKTGDVVYLNGIVFTARDMAHQRMADFLAAGEKLPENLAGGAIFHAGPVAREREGRWELLGIGPTTSMRMEPFSCLLPDLGVRAVIGKGGMQEESLRIFKNFGCVYLLAAPGCSVKHSNCMKDILRVHWLDLGMPEAMWVLKVEQWGPLVVGMDSQGCSIFKEIAKKGREIINEIY